MLVSASPPVHAARPAAASFHARLLDAVGEAVIATDLEGRITFWNRTAERLYGWRAEEALGRPIMDVTVSPEMQTRAAEIMESLVEGRSWSGELEVRRRDGSSFPALVTDTPILDAGGKLVGVVGISRDLRERKVLETRLADAERLESLGRLAAGIAHDFNNVLTAVAIHASDARELAEDPAVVEALDAILASAERSADLVRQLVAFSRSEPLPPSGFDLRGVLAALAGPPATSARPAAARTILLVEDEAAVREGIARTLERGGYRVLAAADGPRALDLEAAHGDAAIDAVVTDSAMPGMRGLELIRRLRERRPGLPALLVSGYSEEVAAGDLAGDVRFLAKPFSASALTATLDEALGAARRPSVR